MHLLISKLSHSCSDNGLFPVWWLAITETIAGSYLIDTKGTNFIQISISIKVQTFSVIKTYLKMSSAKWRPFCFDQYIDREKLFLQWCIKIIIINWISFYLQLPDNLPSQEDRATYLGEWSVSTLFARIDSMTDWLTNLLNGWLIACLPACLPARLPVCLPHSLTH